MTRFIAVRERYTLLYVSIEAHIRGLRLINGAKHDRDGRASPLSELLREDKQQQRK